MSWDAFASLKRSGSKDNAYTIFILLRKINMLYQGLQAENALCFLLAPTGLLISYVAFSDSSCLVEHVIL